MAATKDQSLRGNSCLGQQVVPDADTPESEHNPEAEEREGDVSGVNLLGVDMAGVGVLAGVVAVFKNKEGPDVSAPSVAYEIKDEERKGGEMSKVDAVGVDTVEVNTVEVGIVGLI